MQMALRQRRGAARACQSAASGGAGNGSAASSGEFDVPGPSWLRQQRGAVGGGSGGAAFNYPADPGAGKSGATAFAGSPWRGPAGSAAQPAAARGVGAAAASAAGSTAAAAAGGQGGGGGRPWDVANLQAKLQKMGLAGVMAYDLWSVLGGVCLFNSCYYIGAFFFFWICVFKVPRGLGLAATAQRFAAVFASVWAGSQVTKAPRAAAALALAPLVDRGINWVLAHTGFKTRKAIFFVFLAACLTLAFTLFGVTVVAWA